MFVGNYDSNLHTSTDEEPEVDQVKKKSVTAKSDVIRAKTNQSLGKGLNLKKLDFFVPYLSPQRMDMLVQEVERRVSYRSKGIKKSSMHSSSQLKLMAKFEITSSKPMTNYKSEF